ncbi:hypothetical protein M8J76_012671 [Diaphorina citri]|nr:hypothetical protein M8J76_012671 [Diaphorina citri]
MIIMKIKYNNAKEKTIKEQQPLQISSTKKFQELLALELRNYRTDDELKENIQDIYNNLENSIKTTVIKENQTALKIKNNRSKKLSIETINLIERREELNRKRDKTILDKIEHCELRKLTKKKIKEDILKYENDVIQKILESTGSTKRIIKEISDVKKCWIQKLIDQEGVEKTNRTEIVEVATKFYEKLYSVKKETTHHITYEDSQRLSNIDFNSSFKILKEEVEWALRQLKKDKAPGDDGITNNILINCNIPEFVDAMCTIFSKILEEGKVPEQWQSSKIILLHKKGSKSDINNYRPISLSSTTYKIFAKIIQKRIKKTIDENQPIEQAGFRPSYSTIDHIHSINQLLEKCKEYNIEVHLAFIDFNKAFDSIFHSSIWLALKKANVDEIYINVLKNLYKNAKAYISLDQNGPAFKLERGTRQGCPLSPDLFNCVLELIFKNIDWSNKGIVINGVPLTHLRFADDIVIISDSLENLKSMLKNLKDSSIEHGLSMNNNKTMIMSPDLKDNEVAIDGEKFKTTVEYVYLGQLISFNQRAEREVTRRITIGWKKFWQLKHILKNQKVPNNLRSKCLEICVYPSILYGCQSWALTKKLESRLDSTQHRMQRAILGIKWQDKVSNKKVENQLKTRNLAKEAKMQKWKWAGHVMRMQGERWARTLTEWTPKYSKRSRGRKTRRWRDVFNKIVGNSWPATARERVKWREVIKNKVQ